MPTEHHDVVVPGGGTAATAARDGLDVVHKPPVKPVDVLKRELRTRPELQGATAKNELGGAPTRRPLGSAVHPGYMTVGDAAAHVNPCTGGESRARRKPATGP